MADNPNPTVESEAFVRPDTRALLDMLKAMGRPPIEEAGAVAGREGMRAMAQIGEAEPREMAVIKDVSVPGPAGDIPCRFYDTRESREAGPAVLFLHGGTPQGQRQKMVEQFQEATGKHPILMLSLKAGGTGLNLTAANHVVHLDRWWNPAVENQATDRAFRIGQRKNVQVQKLLCVGTVEERIDSMLVSKQDLADLAVGTGENWVTEMNTAELRELFRLGEDAVGE